ncbi:hypothetical protein ABE28_009330 [Peribacillus muralis]|uniref:Uncharacterized protein n=1 Tax=Peribacillus muralis TaxID=264697 RepID=A0A1B3XMY6_9BACI|nr:hypothetical protein [Peribacillus muralis]AOH54550.1 hypothetical protein ABE28_009330 [Peribacillus muralis]
MNKEELLIIVLNFLKDNIYTSINSIRLIVEKKLESQGIIGEITTGNRYYSATQLVKISHDNARLIN